MANARLVNTVVGTERDLLAGCAKAIAKAKEAILDVEISSQCWKDISEGGRSAGTLSGSLHY